ncbi:MAG: transglutaminase family protein [Pseudomonadota bacterium]
MQLKIRHTTTYRYDQPVDYALQKVRLTPRASGFQAISDWSVTCVGGRIETEYDDHFGNHVDLVNVDLGATEVAITAQGTVTTQDVAGIVPHNKNSGPLWLYLQQTRATEASAAIKALVVDLAKADDRIAAMHVLSADILTAVPYQVGSTHSHTTATEAMQDGAGVCQDHAQIFISALRSAGVPARYVSGYLMMNDRVDQDATHAWAEAYVDGLGWVGFDVSNGISPDERYVRVAVGRDARDAAPAEGLRLGTADEQMVVTLQVQQ